MVNDVAELHITISWFMGETDLTDYIIYTYLIGQPMVLCITDLMVLVIS